MRWLGDKPLHTVLLLTERPGQWSAWLIAPFPLLVASGTGVIWASATAEPALGWAVALCLLVTTLVDWALLAYLPRRGYSFGAVQPSLLALIPFRALIALIPLIAVSTTALLAGWGLKALVLVVLIQVILSLFLAYGTLVEPFRVQLSRVHVSSPAMSNPGGALRIVQISDLHVERSSQREIVLPGLVDELEPDLIVLTGDFLSTSYNTDRRALDDLRALLVQLRAPGGIYAVWGTPEVDLPNFLRPTLLDLGIIILDDHALEVEVREHRLWLMGLRSQRDLAASGLVLRGLMAARTAAIPSVVLHHTPDIMPQAAEMGVDLVLAGHTHGGQWRIPGFGAILTSSRFWKRYEAGHYVEGHTHMYVSRGLGMEGFGAPRARFFCPPELVLITLGADGRLD